MRILESTTHGLLHFTLLAASLVAMPIGGQTLADEEQLFALKGPAGDLTIVRGRQDGFEVFRQEGSSVRWSRTLPARPNFLQAGNEAGLVAVGHLRNDGSARWALVITADGSSWSPPGEVVSIHISTRGDKVLAQTRGEEGPKTLVFDADGQELARLTIPIDTEHVVRFTARGDAVAVSPGPEDDSSRLEIYEIGSGRSEHYAFDSEFPIEDAIALDAHHAVVVGGGTLTMVLFPGADEYSTEGPLGWSISSDGPGYLTLLGATRDGERLLATRGFGRFDLIHRDGEVLWRFDPRDAEFRRRLRQIDLGRIQPFLRPDGVVELSDDSGRGRYLLTWSDLDGGKPVPPRIAWEPAARSGG